MTLLLGGGGGGGGGGRRHLLSGSMIDLLGDGGDRGRRGMMLRVDSGGNFLGRAVGRRLEGLRQAVLSARDRHGATDSERNADEQDSTVHYVKAGFSLSGYSRVIQRIGKNKTEHVNALG
ncbi:hypothetical protein CAUPRSCDRAFT_11561 [Caulochytrium protostelioides]|uniref:Uncharacterized protein n=1 Tax=Caulochytrium protostelioides TaxID=1555241 RepID=A0A4V1ITE2_9FUNG|nr:hypothetical protein CAUPRSCDRAFT_11561 [Caulochytrium protostelioides]